MFGGGCDHSSAEKQQHTKKEASVMERGPASKSTPPPDSRGDETESRWIEQGMLYDRLSRACRLENAPPALSTERRLCGMRVATENDLKVGACKLK